MKQATTGIFWCAICHKYQMPDNLAKYTESVLKEGYQACKDCMNKLTYQDQNGNPANN